MTKFMTYLLGSYEWVVFIPRLFNNPYDEEWDRLLNALMRRGKIKHVDSHSMTLIYEDVEVDIWIENKYYAYGHPFSKVTGAYLNKRPSVKTMAKLAKLEQWARKVMP